MIGWYCTGSTIDEAVKSSFYRHLQVPKPDAVLSIETHLCHVTIVADSCEMQFDIGKNLWLNRARWSRLTREYVPRAGLDRFVSQCREILTGSARDGATANMMFNDPVRYDKKHRWGGCLMGATFTAFPRPMLTFYSRTTYMGYMGMMDATLAHVLAREITGDDAPIAGVHDLGFRWHITSQQVHCFKSLPFMYSQPPLLRKLERYCEFPDRRLKKLTPTWQGIVKWQQRIHRDYEMHGTDMLQIEKYGPFRRIKRRWLEHTGKHGTPPPSLTVDKLDFSKTE